MVRRHIIERLGCIYRDDIGLKGSDWEFSARVCQITHIENVPESLVNVYVNHGNKQLTAFNNEHYDNIILFHNHFLSTFKDIFDKEPKLAKYHIHNICIAYFKKKEIKNGFKYYRQLFTLGISFKEVLMPFYLLVRR